VFSRGSDIRIADEVVCDNLPRASREARRFAGPANLSIESERAAILRLAVMQPIPPNGSSSRWLNCSGIRTD